MQLSALLINTKNDFIVATFPNSKDFHLFINERSLCNLAVWKWHKWQLSTKKVNFGVY